MSGRNTWRFADGALLVGLVALAVLATHGIWLDIFSIARASEEQSHILLAPIIAAWLVWVRRGRLWFCRPQWSLLGPVAIAVGWAGAWYGFVEGVELFRHGGALLMVVGAALTVVGPAFFRAFTPAALALLFLLPVPGRVRQPIAIRLQEMTAEVGQYTLELFGIPITRAGSVLNINGFDVAVAEACNGMRMVAALVLVAFAFVFSVPMRLGVRIFILALTPLIALLVNVIRLIPTVMLYGYSDHHLADAFHDVSGWVMLAVALGILWGILATLRWLEVPIAPYATAQE